MTKQTINKVETFLPLFSGFYNTIWEMDTDNFEHENDVNYDDLEIDYEKYKLDVVNDIANVLTQECPFIEYITIQNISSPRYYNFSNDSANVIIKYKVNEFVAYLIENKDKLNEWLKDRYTSRSGFMSSYDNNYDDWFEQTNGFINLDVDGHRLGALLDFYFENEGVTEHYISYDVESNIYLDNYITITEKYVNSLENWNREIIAEHILREGDFDMDFGYLGVVIRDYKEKAQKFGEDWQKLMAEKEADLILHETKNDDKNIREFEHIKNLLVL